MNETSVGSGLFRYGAKKTFVNTGESRASKGPNMRKVGGRILGPLSTSYLLVPCYIWDANQLRELSQLCLGIAM